MHFTITEAHPYHGPNDTIATDLNCPKCRREACPNCRYYKRGIDSRCVNCGAYWPLENNTPVSGDTPTRAGADAVEPGVGANLGPAREGRKP